MSWTALVPLKAASDRKTRLSPRISVDERIHLSDQFARHVGEAVLASPSISSVILVSEAPLAGGQFTWMRDQGGGLNRELERAVEMLGVVQVVIVSADLPFLRPRDIGALVRAASASGSAIAPDRHGFGTNALALASPAGFHFCFGPGSFLAHSHALPAAAIVRRSGLGLDVDTPEDLELAFNKGVRRGLIRANGPAFERATNWLR